MIFSKIRILEAYKTSNHQKKIPQDILSTKSDDFCMPLGQESLKLHQEYDRFLVTTEQKNE